MKLYLFSFLSLILCFGCNTSENKISHAYFGGEIINPSSKYVILTNDEHKADTIRLDGRNRFIFKIDSLKEGMHSFKHGGEYQSILIEAYDSILLRLNTLEFDESLVYTGQGSKKNNYFINEFLENEKEEKHILKLCQLNAGDYKNHIDSLQNSKLKTLERFSDKYEVTPLFNKIAQANINFHYNSCKEVYPLMHHGKFKGAFLKSLPANFYSYRKNINYNDEFFKNYHNYHIFLRHHFNTLSLERYSEKNKNKVFNWGSLGYNIDKLQLIDSLVTHPDIKNELLYHFTIKYLSFSKNAKDSDVVLNSYLDKTTNEKAKLLMTNYSNSIKKLQNGATFPSFDVVDFDNNIFDIYALIKQPTVITFWSHKYYEHFKKSYKKIKSLEEKYPNVTFININIDDYGYEKPKQTLKDCKFNCDNQYLFKTPEESKKTLAIYPMTKTIIIDENQKIVSSNTNMFAMHFEKQLSKLKK
ncbi:TlpA family protein disulfide reductase [Seonamhaeicola marinus]|uniref:Thioredoxin domain-containing protein n=1 Tax=Seonamhaeicola marinus TaxID=1912246 RepID=A0A5D0I7B1_9FLAO|nr:hypothetical protein [Seonamhaeicola marinus]TYA78750.1 hypothetical protein FUA24_10385 [Seonamhaeicola marinus]